MYKHNAPTPNTLQLRLLGCLLTGQMVFAGLAIPALLFVLSDVRLSMRYLGLFLLCLAALQALQAWLHARWLHKSYSARLRIVHAIAMVSSAGLLIHFR